MNFATWHWQGGIKNFLTILSVIAFGVSLKLSTIIALQRGTKTADLLLAREVWSTLLGELKTCPYHIDLIPAITKRKRCVKGSLLTIRRWRLVLSLFVCTIISLKQPQFFLTLVKKSLSSTFLSEVLSLIRPDFSLLSLYYWSVLPTYWAYKSSWTTQHQLVYSITFSETNNSASWLHTRASDLEIKLVISLKLFIQHEVQSYSIVSTFCWPKWCNFV